MDTGRTNGGILKLRELIEEHPAEFAYDLRSRFHLSIDDIGSSITWLEAVYLVAVLLKDPTSWLQASRNGWDFPVSREWMVAAHHYDLVHAINSKKRPKPYPTPWPDPSKTRIGKTRESVDAVKRKLAKMNPEETHG